jgi:hypothetical protein
VRAVIRRAEDLVRNLGLKETNNGLNRATSIREKLEGGTEVEGFVNAGTVPLSRQGQMMESDK